ncbi:hypothetical protein BFP97_06325 [Roseivirga sp. 4D4]|uniref:hypothetical protein n=1 Tax=Roseivirga sp. 4D4 TaxID=1889784 RepID=UPI000853B101|nr:hypothetical protein [Roseivirga sp. 4D4]OEK01147.1 hypothetical protein BFP97_06325 [Roseivirga sp. 4D4]
MKGENNWSKPDKEDHLAPTPLPKSNEEIPNANLSDNELQNRLELYSKIGGKMDQYFEIQRIKQRYLNLKNELHQTRTIADLHYAQGIRTDLPHANIESIRQKHEQYDQQLRNMVTKDAKDYYKDENSLSRAFKDKQLGPGQLRETFEKLRDESKDIDIDR